MEEKQEVDYIGQYAQKAYEAYNAVVGGRAWNGDLLPSWEQFKNDATKSKQYQGWLAIGKSFIDSQRQIDLDWPDDRRCQFCKAPL